MKKKTAAVVLAAGKGTRMKTDVPKQFLQLGEYPLIYYCLNTFQNSFVDEIVLVCSEGEEEYCAAEIVEKYGFSKVKNITRGGACRYHSVYNGLKALRCMAEGDGVNPCDIVFIHDGARPFVNEEILMRAYEAAEADHAAVVAVPAKDTIKIVGPDGFAEKTADREKLWMAQTPQVFDYYEIYDAYSKLIESESDLKKNGITVTDDAMVLEMFSDRKVRVVFGDYRNIKVTTPEDLMFAQSCL